MENRRDSPLRLAVIGQGYVGLPLSMLAVEAGCDVVGVDADVSRIDKLQRSVSYVDDISHDRLRAALGSGRFQPTTDYSATAGFDVAVITVPTPLRQRSPDLSFVISASRSLAQHLGRGKLVILESTTYPGTTEDVVQPLLEKCSGLTAGPDFSLAYSPERVDPGNTTWTLPATPKVVAGIDEKALSAAQEFYLKLVADVVPVSSPRAAELTKLLENTFRHVNIALVNEFAMFARELGIDMWEVVRAASTKPFGFMPFYPGPGVGGHCLPIDPTYLSWHVQQATGRRFRFVELANDINEQMPDYVVKRVAQGLNRLGRPLHGSRVILLGLAYKKNSSDARESPATNVARLLAGHGAQVSGVDAHVAPDHLADTITRVSLSADVIAQADAVVLLADHDDLDYGLIGRKARWILDCRNRMTGANVESL
ncbi:MAG: nucleotide sugar dehydrogenase [Streptosporangiaceae bacterium]